MKVNPKVIAGVATLFVLAILVLNLFKASNDFSAGKPGPEVSITVSNGETGSSIARDLFNAKVVRSAEVFTSLAISDKRAQGIAPGVHKIHTTLSALEALSELLDQKRLVGLIVVKEGSTVGDVVKSLKLSKEVLSKDLSTKSVAIAISNPNHSLEGQLFPAQYSFEPNTTANDALGEMAKKFKSSIIDSGVLKSYGKYSPYQVLTIASMVQVEGDPEVYSKVARVIYNRLSIGMPLQLNSTVQYAANLRGQIHLTTKATQINSPYNTYRNVGLPPTPINNPSVAAIAAAQKPIAGDWLYFITVKPRDTRFTKSFETFQTWVTEYNKNRLAGAFK